MTELNFLPRVGSGNVTENDMLLEQHVREFVYVFVFHVQPSSALNLLASPIE